VDSRNGRPLLHGNSLDRPGAVRELCLPLLELQHTRVQDHAVADFDRSADGLVLCPGLGARDHSIEERKQGLADFPAGGIPEVGRLPRGLSGPLRRDAVQVQGVDREAPLVR